MVLVNIPVCFWTLELYGDVDFDFKKNLMHYFLQLLLFTDSQILPRRIHFCAVYYSANNWKEALRNKF